MQTQSFLSNTGITGSRPTSALGSILNLPPSIWRRKGMPLTTHVLMPLARGKVATRPSLHSLVNIRCFGARRSYGFQIHRWRDILRRNRQKRRMADKRPRAFSDCSLNNLHQWVSHGKRIGPRGVLGKFDWNDLSEKLRPYFRGKYIPFQWQQNNFPAKIEGSPHSKFVQ